MLTVIAAWSTYNIQLGFIILMLISELSTDIIQADIIILTMIVA